MDESADSKDPEVAKAWQLQFDDTGKIKAYIKKGGSAFDKSSPYIRTESVFKK